MKSDVPVPSRPPVDGPRLCDTEPAIAVGMRVWHRYRRQFGRVRAVFPPRGHQCYTYATVAYDDVESREWVGDLRHVRD